MNKRIRKKDQKKMQSKWLADLKKDYTPKFDTRTCREFFVALSLKQPIMDN